MGAGQGQALGGCYSAEFPTVCNANDLPTVCNGSQDIGFTDEVWTDYTDTNEGRMLPPAMDPLPEVTDLTNNIQPLGYQPRYTGMELYMKPAQRIIAVDAFGQSISPGGPCIPQRRDVASNGGPSWVGRGGSGMRYTAPGPSEFVLRGLETATKVPPTATGKRTTGKAVENWIPAFVQEAQNGLQVEYVEPAEAGAGDGTGDASPLRSMTLTLELTAEKPLLRLHPTARGMLTASGGRRSPQDVILHLTSITRISPFVEENCVTSLSKGLVLTPEQRRRVVMLESQGSHSVCILEKTESLALRLAQAINFLKGHVDLDVVGAGKRPEPTARAGTTRTQMETSPRIPPVQDTEEPEDPEVAFEAEVR